jgi:release factor glutamine methyltransferase
VIRALAAQLPGDSALLDAQILLMHVTNHNRAWLLSHPDITLTLKQEKILKQLVRKLQDGIPLPYVLGHWEFFGLDFYVTPDVLIPRPETELIVEAALSHVRSIPQSNYHILDVGTGSGIIAICLAIHIPQAELVATDISAAALKIARSNAERHGVIERIRFEEADLLPEGVQSQTFDIICANLPYIPRKTLKGLDIFGKEPDLALDGGPDGLDLISRLLIKLEGLNFAGSLILIEIEQGQGLAVSALAQAAFPTATIRIQRDLAGFDRLVVVNI